MKIVVGFGWGRDPAAARVTSDGIVDWGRVRPAVNDDDPAAAALAADLAAALGASVVGVTFGGGDSAWAAARGAAETVVVDDATPGADTLATARVLAAAVRSIDDVALVLLGDGAWDRAVPVAVAAELGLRCVAQVVGAVAGGETAAGAAGGADEVPAPGAVRVTRRLAGGDELVDVVLPAVLCCAASGAEARPPGMRQVLAARRLPQTRRTLADLGVGESSALTTVGTRPPATTGGQILGGADAPARLIAALRADGVL